MRIILDIRPLGKRSQEVLVEWLQDCIHGSAEATPLRFVERMTVEEGKE